MEYFKIKNFEKYQHYKNRRPPWIKLYNDLLDDYEYCQLPDASKSHLAAIMLLASRYDNKIPYDEKWIAEKISAKSEINISLLGGFVIKIAGKDTKASKTLAERKQSAPLEREKEKEKEKIKKKHVNFSNDFEVFWKYYPRKEDKDESYLCYKEVLRIQDIGPDVLITASKNYNAANKESEQRYIKFAHTFLSKGAYKDWIKPKKAKYTPKTYEPNFKTVSKEQRSKNLDKVKKMTEKAGG